MKTASNGSLPLYSQIVQDIRNKILNGTYKYNERLPNEKWLCNLYDISRTTLRKSIDELIAEGLLERHSNKGVYVVYSKFDTGFDRPYSLFPDDVPFNIQQLYLIESFFPQFNPWLLTDHSLYEIMESDYQIKIVKTVQVVTTGSVSKNQSELLKVPIRTPLHHTTSTIYSSTGDIVEYQQNDILTNVIPYSYKVQRP